MGDFGNKFRKARESKQLSLDDVSHATKVGSRMLQAIEEEHFEQLPGGVFNKGFIRAYAKHLGLDSENAITEYLECLRQSQVDSHEGGDSANRTGNRPVGTAKAPTPASPKAAVKGETSVGVEDELPQLQLPRAADIRSSRKEYLDRPSSGFPARLIVALLVLGILGSVLWVRHSRHSHTVAVPSGAPSAAAPSAAASLAAASRPPTTTNSSTALAPRPVTLNAQIPAGAQTATAAKTSAPAPVTAGANQADANQPATNQGVTPQIKVEKKGDVTIRSFGNSTADASAKPDETPLPKLTLVIRANENSWISVTSDGQLITQETLIAPAAASFHANRELTVRVGNAAAVSFLWNGQQIPSQGGEAEAKTFIFGAEGMRISAPNQPSE